MWLPLKHFLLFLPCSPIDFTMVDNTQFQHPLSCQQIILVKFSYVPYMFDITHIPYKNTKWLKSNWTVVDLIPRYHTTLLLAERIQDACVCSTFPMTLSINEGRHCGCQFNRQLTKGLELIRLQDWCVSYEMRSACWAFVRLQKYCDSSFTN